ncbi:MAG: type II toxin-antitoxin system VapC family toxin [Actinomycetota bacterium]|nr:type II toxin-antitoxin system VapC family toxin [Actinomycetota bacterium]
MIYVDTSVLVAAITNERQTDDAQRWLAAQPAGELAIPDWVTTEVSSALSIKTRIGQVTPSERNRALEAFNSLSEQSLVILAVSRSDCLVAARFSDRLDIGLRAGDALHLAVALRVGAVLHTLDRRLAEGAEHVGVEAHLALDRR